MHPLISVQFKGGRTDLGWVLAPLPAALRKWLSVCEPAAAPSTVTATSPCKGCSEASVRQAHESYQFCATQGRHICTWKWREPRHTELQDINSSGCSCPGHVFLPCSWVFHVMLWGALRSKAQSRKLHRGDPKPSCEQIFKKKTICTPLLYFCHGKCHSGSSKMVSDPLWAHANQASQPVGSEDIFLESHAQVLQRPGGEYEDQKPPSQKSQLHVLPWKWNQR